jgi:4-methyl-5(b-hydroxyethyl)-thiazole monophosphate biosynthesis
MAKRVLVPLAEGFEEIEAVTIVDVLRRAGIEVVTAGLRPGPVKGAHGMALAADAELASVQPDSFDAVVLPGGMPGTRHLMRDERVLAAVRKVHAAGKTTAAICAAPLVLDAAGIVGGLPITAHPSVHGELAHAELRPTTRVVRSGNVITSQGPGTALEFSLALVAELAGPGPAKELAAGMLVPAG